MIDMFIKNGVDLNIRDPSGNTALHLAAEMGKLSILAIEMRIKLNKFWNILNLGDEKLIRLLIDNGAKVDVKNSFKERPQAIALKKGRASLKHHPIVDIFLPL